MNNTPETFTLYFIGMDGSENYQTFTDLPAALAEADLVAGSGGHCVSVANDDGDELFC